MQFVQVARFCPGCGKQAVPTAVYCSSCGTSIKTGMPNTALANSNPEPMVRVSQKQRNAINFFSPKCSFCSTKGEIVYLGWQKIKVEHGFGVVVRQQTSTVSKRDVRGRRYTENAVTKRQERVPVVRTTFRYHYECGSCRNAWANDKIVEEEDFSPPSQQQPIVRESNTVYTKEVLRVPCKYCGTLLDPIQNKTCPQCGGKII